MWQVLTILVLLGIMVGLLNFEHGPTPGGFDPKSLAATGFIILAAFTTGELFKRFKIPSLLGYIAAGIVFGPNLAKLILGPEANALFGTQVIEDLALINILTVGVIGTMGGGELKISDIKESWKLILLTTVLIIITAIPLTIGVVVGLTYLPVDLVGFLSDEGLKSVADNKMMHRVGAALLFAILAVAMSPAATLAIIQETRAKGKFTSLVLGAVVVADLALVALFLVGFAFVKLLISPEGFSSSALLAALPGIGLEFGWALVIGSVTGVIFILYMRFIGREMLFFTVAAIFAASYVCTALHAEALLAFLTAGFIVQNFSKHGHDLIHTLEQISLPVFIIYFMTQAAQLDLAPVLAYLPLTLILAGVRAFAFYGSSKVAAKAMKAGETSERYLWMSFLSRGGVDLVLAAMVANAIKPWGVDFQTVIMSTVVVHIVAGPPLLKYALSKAGETEDSKQEQTQDAANIKSLGEEDVSIDDFPEVAFDDKYLNMDINAVRDSLIELHHNKIDQPLHARQTHLAESLEQVQGELSTGLNALMTLLERHRDDTPEVQQKALIQLHIQSRRKLQPWVRSWENLPPVAFDDTQAQDIIDAVRGMIPFDDQHGVIMEPHLYNANPEDTRSVAFLKGLRRVQRTLSGETRRTIPTGRLWRYYVELSVPRYFAAKADQSSRAHELFWYELEHTIRRFDEIFFLVEKLILGETIEFDEVEEEDDHHGHGEHHGEHHDDHHHEEHEFQQDDGHVDEPLEILQSLMQSEMSAYERAVALVQAYKSHHEQVKQVIQERLDESLQVANDGFSWGLRKAFQSFLEAVSHAGTIELTSYSYRPSKLYESSNRAEGRLRQRLQREQDIVSAYIGWIVVDHQLTLLVYWFEQYQTRIIDPLHLFFNKQCVENLDHLKSICASGPKALAQQPEKEIEEASPNEEDAEAAEVEGQTLPEPVKIDWPQWKEDTMTPTIETLRTTLDHALVSYGKGVISRRLIDTLEYRVARLTEEVNLLVQDPVEIAPEELDKLATMRLGVRQWFSHKLVSEVSLLYIEFNERLERIIRRCMMVLVDLEQMLNYSMMTAQRELEETGDHARANEMGLSALDRAIGLIEQMTADMLKEVEHVEKWIIEETATLVDGTTAPFMDHELGGVKKMLERKILDDEDRIQSIRDRVAMTASAIKQSAYSAVAPVYEEFLEDMRQIMHEAERPEQRDKMRDYFQAERATPFSTLPPIYKRLFNPVPLDLPEFYVARPELETRVLDAIAQWGQEQPTSILLFGDRGVGKRTFIHNLVPIRVYDLAQTFQNIPIQTIRLGDDVSTEQELVQHCWPLLPNQQPKTLRALKRRIDALENRQIVLLENATKCYQRTSEGITLCKSFLDMVSKTSDKVLWIFIFESPAAVLLDTMIDLYDYFTNVFEVEPFEEEQIEQMIMKRHRVSGFNVHFHTPAMSLIERTKHPFMASEASRQPKHAFFEQLTTLSHGNALAALLEWLRSIEQDPQDDRKLHIHPLVDKQPEQFVPALSLRKRLLLSLLLQHNALSIKQLGQMMMLSIPEVRTELDHLRRLGIVEPLSGDKQLVQLRDIAAPKLTHELRQINLV